VDQTEYLFNLGKVDAKLAIDKGAGMDPTEGQGHNTRLMEKVFYKNS